jgi:hypothetical protein
MLSGFGLHGAVRTRSRAWDDRVAKEIVNDSQQDELTRRTWWIRPEDF